MVSAAHRHAWPAMLRRADTSAATAAALRHMELPELGCDGALLTVVVAWSTRGPTSSENCTWSFEAVLSPIAGLWAAGAPSELAVRGAPHPAPGTCWLQALAKNAHQARAHSCPRTTGGMVIRARDFLQEFFG